jgi:hypothetical protein
MTTLVGENWDLSGSISADSRPALHFSPDSVDYVMEDRFASARGLA